MFSLHAGHTPVRSSVLPAQSSPARAAAPAATSSATTSAKPAATPASQSATKPAIHQLREAKAGGPEVASLLKPATRPQPQLPERWVLARSGLAARVRASLYPLASGWRERQAEAMRLYLRRASQVRSPGLEALHAEQRSFWQETHPADLLRSLMDPYRRLLANHGLILPAEVSAVTQGTTADGGVWQPDVQTLQRLMGFFTEEQHAVEGLANELAKTELASISHRWALALEDIRALIKAAYVERVTESPGRPSPVAPASGALLVAGGRVEVAGVRPADHAQALG